MTSSDGSVNLAESVTEKDLGVLISKDLSFDDHVHIIVKKANQITGLLWRSFEYINEETFLPLYKCMIRSHLEYAAPIWSPGKWGLVELIESVQRRATKRVPGLSNLPYEDRLRKLKLPTLVYRRLRGDLITAYKYTHGAFYDLDTCLPPFLENARSRGHSLRLLKIRNISNVRKYFFGQRISDWWNALPSDVVQATDVVAFKNKLDTHFKDHPMLYNYRALDHPHKPNMTII